MKLNKSNILDWLLEKELLDEIGISELDGERFAIVSGWDTIEKIYYAIVQEIHPESISYYESLGKINKRYREIGIKNGDLSPILDELDNALVEAGFDNYNRFEDIIGMEWGFSDEYTTCSDCDHVIKTSPNSYFWTPDYFIGDGFIICNQCFNATEDYQIAYLEDLINSPDKANQLLNVNQLENFGFVRLDEEWVGTFEYLDDPRKIFRELSEKYEDVVFSITDVGQFHTNYTAFVRGDKILQGEYTSNNTNKFYQGGMMQ